MDMHQKRKMRQEKKSDNNNEKLTKVGINWDNPTYGKPLANLYK